MVTPGAGYMVDPKNPNGVIPISSAPPASPAIPMSGGYVAQPAPSIADSHTALSSALAAAGAQPTQASQIAAAAVTPTDTTYAKASGYAGPSIVDFLNTAGQPSDYGSRSQLATKFGIQNYTGTAEQNTQLLHILQGHNTGVSPTGVPSNTGQVLGASTGAPDTSSPLDLASLSGKGLDLSSILGVGAGKSNTSSDIAGLLSLYGAQTDAQKKYEETANSLTAAMSSMGGEAGDLKSAMDQQGVGANYGHVQQLNLEAAQLKGEIDAFDAETQQGFSNIEDQQIPLGLVQGQKAAFQKQRDLTKLAKSAKLAGIISLSTAYEGNAELGMKLAKQSVDLKYAPIQNNIDTLKEQLSIAANSMQEQDSKNSKIISALLDYKTSQLSDEKDTALKLQTMGVQAASGGAPLSVVQSAIATGDPVQAASVLSSYLKGPTESVAATKTSSASGGGGTKPVLSQSKVNTGAANAGVSAADFSALDGDVQNFFANAPAASIKAVNDTIKDVKSGAMTVQEATAWIDAGNIPDSLKNYLKQKIGSSQTASAAPAGGGFLSTVGNVLGGAWDFVKSAIGGVRSALQI